jgi:hypothetical protein
MPFFTLAEEDVLDCVVVADELVDGFEAAEDAEDDPPPQPATASATVSTAALNSNRIDLRCDLAILGLHGRGVT